MASKTKPYNSSDQVSLDLMLCDKLLARYWRRAVIVTNFTNRMKVDDFSATLNSETKFYHGVLGFWGFGV